MNLVRVLDDHPADRVALIGRGATTTYGQLRSRAAGLRRKLAALGVGPGDRVAIVAANDASFVVGFLGVVGSGAIAVPLNPASPPAELVAQMAAVGARLALAGPGAAVPMGDTPAASAPEAPTTPPGPPAGSQLAGAGVGGVPVVVLDDPDDDPDDDRPGDPATVGSAPIVDRADGDVACLLFTAGTAGAPKAAMLTHGALLANQTQIQAREGGAIESSDVSLGVIPLHHVYGLNVVLLLSLRVGAAVALVEHFDPARALETIAAHGVTVVAGVPAMWRDWLALPADPDAFAGVRLAVSGAAALGATAAAAFRARFGVTIHEGYGLTEAGPAVTASVDGDGATDGSIGLPLPGVEVRLVDDDGDDALAGDPGEIWVRGPNLFAGYWGDPAATAGVLTGDGWLRTGDIAVADVDGWLRIVDRAKDVINVSGFNVYPAEVETALAQHPAVLAVAVLGVPHAHSGETVSASVVLRAGSAVGADELIAYCATRLARYKCPTAVAFVDALPYGTTGKLLRRALSGDRSSDAPPAG